MILDGRTEELTAELTEQMQAAADALRFEYAASLRDRLRAIQGLQNHQRVIATAYSDTDAVGFQRGAKCCFTVLHFTDGNLTGKDKSFLDEPMEPDGEALAALVQQYYEGRGAYPRQVLLPCALEGQDALERLLTEAAGHKVALAVPQRGDKCRLTEMAANNAREEILARDDRRRSAASKRSNGSRRALELDAPPERIEAFDISNTRRYRHRRRHDRVPCTGGRASRTTGSSASAATDGQNDYGSMHEVAHAPLSALCGRRPGLLPAAGPAAHRRRRGARGGRTGGARRASGCSVPVFGMVKDDRHRTRALITPGGHEIGIAANPAVFAFVGTHSGGDAPLFHRLSAPAAAREPARPSSIRSPAWARSGAARCSRPSAASRPSARLRMRSCARPFRRASPARSTTTITRKEEPPCA